MKLLFFFSKQFKPTIQRSNHHRWGCLISTVWKTALMFCPCSINRYFNIFKMTYVNNIWNDNYICDMKSGNCLVNSVLFYKRPVCGRGVIRAELHWPLTKIMWCHFNLTSGLFLHPASFSSGFALSCAVALGPFGPEAMLFPTLFI